MPNLCDCAAGEWQQEVAEWILSRFGAASLADPRERIRRVVEEACELGQAAKLPKKQIAPIARYVYAHPVGSLQQEAAGLVVALFALAHAHGFDLLHETRKEIDRILSVPIEVSRQRQALKAQAGIARMPGGAIRNVKDSHESEI